MIADKLLPHLDKVRSTGHGRWIASCPSHNDKNPSLVITETDDRLLLKCFTGCSAYEIVSAVGLEITDLFPENLTHHARKPLKKPFNAEDILIALGDELVWVEFLTNSLVATNVLNGGAQDRIRIAHDRFKEALKAGGLQ